jgi:hypothetical protein
MPVSWLKKSFQALLTLSIVSPTTLAMTPTRLVQLGSWGPGAQLRGIVRCAWRRYYTPSCSDLHRLVIPPSPGSPVRHCKQCKHCEVTANAVKPTAAAVQRPLSGGTSLSVSPSPRPRHSLPLSLVGANVSVALSLSESVLQFCCRVLYSPPRRAAALSVSLSPPRYFSLGRLLLTLVSGGSAVVAAVLHISPEPLSGLSCASARLTGLTN